MEAHAIRVPDYAGNNLFNTLGNIAVNPRVGLALVDFEGGGLLQITGRARIRWDLDDPGDSTGGTRRFWDVEVDRWIVTPGAAPAGWTFLDYSPTLP